MPDAETSRRANGPIAFTLLILTWSSAPLFLKHFTQFLDGWTVNGIRYSVAALIWLPFLVMQQRRGKVTPGLYKAACIPAACHIISQVCWGLSPYHNDASIMHFIGRSTFLFMIVLSFLFLREERLLLRRPVFWLGVTGTIIGILSMYAGGARTGSTSPLGVALLLGTGLGWALYGVTVKKYLSVFGSRESFAVVSLYTVPVHLTLLFGVGEWQAMAGVQLQTWMLMLLAALLTTALAHVLLYEVLRQYGPIVSDGVFQLIPFGTVLGAYLLFGERLTALQWSGGLMLVAAAYALILAKRQAQRAS